MGQYGTLVLLCGKMGSGKSTKAIELSEQIDNSIVISEDHWLATLYPSEIASFEDYLEYSARLKLIIKPHVQTILKKGLTVVLDYPGNTKRQRQWLKSIFLEINCAHRLYYLQAQDEVCLSRLANRRVQQPERSKFDTPEVFRQVTSYFEAPQIDECFDITVLEQS